MAQCTVENPLTLQWYTDHGMFTLSDFHHLPQIELYFEQIARQANGLVVVAGLGNQPTINLPVEQSFLPSGRSLIFSILLQETLLAQPRIQAVVISQEKDAKSTPTLHLNRPLRQRITFATVYEPSGYPELIEQAAIRDPGLLVIDQLNERSIPAALHAASQGVHILGQLDSVMYGAAAARQLLDWGGKMDDLAGLSWIVGVQRLATLCPKCKSPFKLDAALEQRLRRRFPAVEDNWLITENPIKTGEENTAGELMLPKADFYQAPGCEHCHQSGRAGEISAFDIFRGGINLPPMLESDSQLPIEEYMLHLAALGHIRVEDVLNYPAELLRRTYYTMAASTRLAVDTSLAMKRKLAELEAANRVSTQRTGMLVSLHDISQTLISSTDLEDLAGRICRHACDICHADRAILYYLHEDNTVEYNQGEILAVKGTNHLPKDTRLHHQSVDAGLIRAVATGNQPRLYLKQPPGFPAGEKNQPTIGAGLMIPLVTQERQVGALLVQAVKKNQFSPGEVAMLQTLAGQAALAMQRAGLIEELRQKISQLEAAQAELVKKERLEHELEIARQVQQSLLPLTFPETAEYAFVGRCEPARQVGGDFYDAFWIDESHIGLAIADVSGKGIPAALFMALCRSLLLAEARRGNSPAATLRNVNRLLLELTKQQTFVTFFFAVLDTSTKKLSYVRAGHDRPLLLRMGEVMPLNGDGTALGIFEELHLEDSQLTLQSGDRLVLYTDGLIDVISPDEQRFELRRLVELFQKNAHLPASELCATIFANLAEYQGGNEQFDDMTMLILDVK